MDNFREWLSDNLRYILLGIAVCLVVVIVVCVVRLVGGSSSDSKKTDAQAVEQVTEASQNTAASSTAPEASSSLKKDDASILELVKKYYTAVAAKDTATLATIVSPWTDDMQSSILSNTMIESYDNISTYSKAGPSDGTYVVYAYYDGKIKDISTEAPSLALLYVVTDDSGSLVVGDRNASTEVADFISKATAASDVQALKNDVNQKLLEAENSDPDLKAFLDSQSSGALGETESVTEADNSSSNSASGGTATTTAGVNIRAKASADAQIVAVTYAGAEVKVIERGDQWTHINFDYQGTTYDGYVSTQYLQFGGSGTAQTDQTSGSGSASAAQTGQTSGTGTSGAASGGSTSGGAV
ncbi:SH3 domain-containing protein [Porcincola intestinalis]|uniref:SH3 domain-containing protein n=1 Tax=Porcincola intestinalis TaxID=2606632 RepID=UPI002A91ECC1|nr:SH3 domain-containing protein [Porcincola intestinalis]MDY5578907.1 SH3 domain-containing protein [Porcincola intestinalis]